MSATDAKPLNVIAALVAVSGQVGAIAKERRPTAGPQYDYRGIEDVLNALHDPLIDSGVVIVPTVSEWAVVDRPNFGKKGGTETQLRVSYRIYGPGGVGDVIEASVFAAGIDDQDKGSGKAMSYAYKTLVFQLLCIPTDVAQDGEQAPLERQVVPEDYVGWHSKAAHDDWWQTQADILRQLPDELKQAAVKSLIDAGHFGEDRRPKTPFHHDYRGAIEIITKRAVAGQVVAAAAPAPPAALHSVAAIEVVAEALNIDDPLNPPDGVLIDDAAWDLAEVEDLDAHDWGKTAKAMGWRRPDIVKRAKEVALDIAAPEPFELEDIHGPLAVELRNSLLRSAAPF